MKTYYVKLVNGDVIFFECAYDSVLEVADWLSYKKYVDVVDVSGDMYAIFKKHIVIIKEV